MDISIITPIYKGNQYINNILRMVGKNAKSIPDLETELVLVNDSPEYPLEYDHLLVDGFALTVCENKKNLGIQKARINGIMASHGEYVMILDQDDEITADALNSQYGLIRETGAVISNGYNEGPDGNREMLFRSKKQMEYLNNINFYMYYGNMIASPGLCLIKKDLIPKFWLQNTMQINGADDWLLWVLFLAEDNKFALNPSLLYTHKNVGSNCSADNGLMLKSSREALFFAYKSGKLSKRKIDICKKRLNMREKYEGKTSLVKIIEYLKNPVCAYYVMKIRKHGD